MLQIRVFSEDLDGAPEVHYARAFPFRIGRDPSNELLLDDPSVSKFHCLLEVREEGGFQLRNLSATNGIVVDGEQLVIVAVPSRAAIRCILGRLELEIGPAEVMQDRTEQIDLEALRARSRGQGGESWGRFLTVWGLGAWAVLLAVEWIDEIQKPEPERFGKVAVMVIFALVAVAAVALIPTLVSKLHRHEYRFRRFYRIVLGVLVAMGVLETALKPILGQVPSSEIQGWVSRGFNSLGAGMGIVLLLVEIFPSLRWRKAIGAAALLVAMYFGSDTLKGTFSHGYTAYPDPVPQIAYPFINTESPQVLEGMRPTAAIFEDLERDRPGTERERIEHLKLR